MPAPNTNPRELTGYLTSRDRVHLDGLWRRYNDATDLTDRTDLATLIEQHVALAVTRTLKAQLEELHKSRRGS